jgi:hypothetical protein
LFELFRCFRAPQIERIKTSLASKSGCCFDTCSRSCLIVRAKTLAAQQARLEAEMNELSLLQAMVRDEQLRKCTQPQKPPHRATDNNGSAYDSEGGGCVGGGGAIYFAGCGGGVDAGGGCGGGGCGGGGCGGGGCGGGGCGGGGCGGGGGGGPAVAEGAIV